MFALMGLVATASAGGLMTNTNYHIAFDRMMARGASFDIDATFSNPAGLVWGHEGWQVSLNFQKPWQYRDIELTANNKSTLYEGKASAPIVPALFASYKKDKWAVSAMLGIVGSGGFVEYKDGVPMFNVLLQNQQKPQLCGVVGFGLHVATNIRQIVSFADGRPTEKASSNQGIYSKFAPKVQAGLRYAISPNLSVFGMVNASIETKALSIAKPGQRNFFYFPVSVEFGTTFSLGRKNKTATE